MKRFAMHPLASSPHSHMARHTVRYRRLPAVVAVIGMLALGALLIIAGPSYLPLAGGFHINHINISGCRITRPSEILAYAHLQPGMNLLRVDLAQTSTRLEQYPYIQKAVVERKLPDTLEIFIVEREPRALILLDDYYVLDTHGEIFKKAESAERHYPVLTGLTEQSLYHDRQRCQTMIRTALQLLDDIENDARFKGSQIEIGIDQTSGFTIRMSPDPVEVELGWGAFPEKIDSLWKIVDDLRSKGLSPDIVKLKSPHKAYVTVRG
jgi:cell division protein FtsQ